MLPYALHNWQAIQPDRRTHMLNKSDPPTDKKEPVVIKKYANRRLYNTETSTYVTLDDLATMVKSERDFVVFDAKAGDDLTHTVLTQIIVDQESRVGAQTLLPIPFLRQLIRFYGDSSSGWCRAICRSACRRWPRGGALPQAVSAPSPPPGPSRPTRSARKNLAMFEQAMLMFSPSARQELTKPSEDADKASGQGRGQG